MNVAAWNIRGMNDVNKVKALKNLVNRKNIQVSARMVNRVKHDNIKKISNTKKRILGHWQWMDNYCYSYKGRLWA